MCLFRKKASSQRSRLAKAIAVLSHTLPIIPPLLVGATVCLPVNGKDFNFNHGNILGTSMEIFVDAINGEEASKAEEAALLEIDRLRKILSNYDPDSDLNQFLSTPLGSPRYMPVELIEVIVACDWWRTRTQGHSIHSARNFPASGNSAPLKIEFLIKVR